jgi:hypothetical protein
MSELLELLAQLAITIASLNPITGVFSPTRGAT